MHGIDLDWEYPGRGGAICNTVSPNDSANYLVLLRELRAQMDLEFPNDRKLLTAAVRVQPFDGADGKPMANVAAFAMNTQNPISMYVNKTNVTPKGGPGDRNEINYFCNEGAVYSGMWKWKEIRGAILTGGVTSPAPGWTRYWDDATQTPWLYGTAANTFISYDDVQSMTIKVNYAKNAGLRGVMLWDMSYDYNNELINVLQNIHCTSNCPVVTTVPTPTATATTSVPVTTTTSSGPVTTTTTPVGKCTGIAAWNSATIYATAGAKVTYSGHLFTNAWWTQNETPVIGDTSGVWKDG
ncbi:hypothetical protein BGZ97_009553, partial [Linnemannia gamsii]